MHFPHNEAQRNECDVWCDIYRWHQKCLWICKNTGWQDGSRNLAVEEYSCPVTTQSTLPESHKFPKKKKKKGRNINRARSKHKLLGLALPHSNPYFLFFLFLNSLWYYEALKPSWICLNVCSSFGSSCLVFLLLLFTTAGARIHGCTVNASKQTLWVQFMS